VSESAVKVCTASGHQNHVTIVTRQQCCQWF